MLFVGGGGYLGGETARTLVREGIAVGVCDIREEPVQRVVEQIVAQGGEAKGYIADVSDSADITSAIARCAEDFGRLDIMLHAAGGSTRIAGPQAKWVPLVEQKDYVIDKVLKVNLYGAFWASRAAARIMLQQGEGGKILHLTSTGVSQLFGGAVLLIAGALSGGSPVKFFPVNAAQPGVFSVIIVASVISYCLWFVTVQKEKLSKLFIIKFSEPLFSALFSWLIIDENIFQWQYLAAFVLIFLGVCVADYEGHKAQIRFSRVKR